MKVAFILVSLFFNIIQHSHKETITLVVSDTASVRTRFGTEKLSQSLISSGYEVNKVNKPLLSSKGITIAIGEWNNVLVNKMSAKAGCRFDKIPGKEGFSIKSLKNTIVIKGADASGTLYGCLELADRVKEQGKLPESIDITDQPEMVLRGACVGLQKPYYLPGRDVYEYPYTPETFPWFYDKDLWIKYLDLLVENRMNSLYLWNGHPFASLVKLKDYPYAVEVDDQTFKKNEEMFAFLTEEANKRGIFVIQMFYNIIVSKPFAEKNGMKTQDRSRPIIPIIADYTRKSIAAFIEKYPNVGLLTTLGEAMNTEEDDVKWFTETIIPGVKDGLKALGRTDEPPIILRAHDTNAPLVMKNALPIYKNLYTMHKYNGESLTTYEPRGPWSEIHKELSRAGSVHIENVHILANLEPFRYGSPDFIQKSVQAMHRVHGANGLHLYPQASYWDWPYSADNTTPRLLEMDRDWIWYQAWSRYAWNCNRDRNAEKSYWTNELNQYYNCTQGDQILEAYEQEGEIAPKLLRRFGITDGNRETLSLGLFMSQLVNPTKWKIYPSFYQSNGPEGEILIEYAEKEWKKQPHVGETPPQIIREVVQHGKLAVDAIEKAAPSVKNNREEFERLRNDMHCYEAMANFFSEKVKAAMLVLRYNYSKNISDLEQAVPLLDSSLHYYQQLVNLTKDTYLYANSMQTKQRRIPIGGNDGKNKTWTELLPYYQEELANFKKNIQLLKSSPKDENINKPTEPLHKAEVKLPDKNDCTYPLAQNQKLFTDTTFVIKDLAPELQPLTGICFSFKKQNETGTILHFQNARPVNVLVGYFNTANKSYLPEPSLETNAHANDFGQAEIKISNALDIPGMPPVNVHSYYFDAGKNVLDLGKGNVLILGFTDASQKIVQRDAGLTGDSKKEAIDWLFY